MAKQNKPRFIRRGGRIIPIGVKREFKAAHEIARKGGSTLGIVTASAGVTAASLYGAGRLFKLSGGRGKLGQLAKALKFGGVAGSGLVGAHAIGSLDKKVKSDEKSKLFNLGSGATSAAGIAGQIGVGYLAYRFGKRFEVAGKRGLNVFKKDTWKKLKHVKDI